MSPDAGCPGRARPDDTDRDLMRAPRDRLARRTPDIARDGAAAGVVPTTIPDYY